MPPKTKKRFSLDTRTFATIWHNHNQKGKDWKTFVMNVFERFSTGNELSNQAMLLGHDKNWKKWSDDQKYEFISERCYSKCIGIRNKQAKIGNNVNLPSGYKQRKGTVGSSRPTPGEIGEIFGFKS